MAADPSVPSHEAIRHAVENVGAKKAAAAVGVSLSLVYKWCQPAPAEEERQSGARNPLDRIAALLAASGDTGLAAWLCRRAGGFFTPNVPLAEENPDVAYFARLQRMVQDFSALLGTMSESMSDDSRIDIDEARAIRAQWEELKQWAEAFVVACEEGRFNAEH